MEVTSSSVPDNTKLPSLSVWMVASVSSGSTERSRDQLDPTFIVSIPHRNLISFLNKYLLII